MIDQPATVPTPRILIVDDDADFLQMLQDALALVPPRYTVVGAATSDAALAALRATPFDLILVDYRLAGRDGLALLGDLRSEAPTLPVIMITGYPSLELRQRAEALGVSAFLIKPVAIAELRRAVQAVLK